MNNFDLMAKDFDTQKRIERAKVIAEEIRLHIKDASIKSALEYGCGTGLVGLELSDDFERLLLVDSSPEMITQVEQKAANMDRQRVSTLCADFMTSVPHNLRVDYIFSSLVLHHVKDTEGIFRRFYDALCDDGHLLIVDIDADDGSFHAKYPGFDGHNGFEQTLLIDLATKTGFKKAEAKTFYYGRDFCDGKESVYSLFILDAIK